MAVYELVKKNITKNPQNKNNETNTKSKGVPSPGNGVGDNRWVDVGLINAIIYWPD